MRQKVCSNKINMDALNALLFKRNQVTFCFNMTLNFQDKTKSFQHLENKTMLKDICLFIRPRFLLSDQQVSNEVASVRNHSLNYSSDTNCDLSTTSSIKAILFYELQVWILLSLCTG